jgi:hypothetical protein
MWVFIPLSYYCTVLCSFLWITYQQHIIGSACNVHYSRRPSALRALSFFLCSLPSTSIPSRLLRKPLLLASCYYFVEYAYDMFSLIIVLTAAIDIVNLDWVDMPPCGRSKFSSRQGTCALGGNPIVVRATSQLVFGVWFGSRARC